MEMTPMALRISICAAVLLSSEILASGSIWCGTPIDWSGQHLHFWSFEILRLPYWGLSFALATLVWLIAWHKRSYLHHRVVLCVLPVALAVRIEVSNSIWCWRRLPWTKTTCASLTTFRYYFWEHLMSWFVAMALGLIIWRAVWRRTQNEASRTGRPD